MVGTWPFSPGVDVNSVHVIFFQNQFDLVHPVLARLRVGPRQVSAVIAFAAPVDHLVFRMIIDKVCLPGTFGLIYQTPGILDWSWRHAVISKGSGRAALVVERDPGKKFHS